MLLALDHQQYQQLELKDLIVYLLVGKNEIARTYTRTHPPTHSLSLSRTHILYPDLYDCNDGDMLAV